MRLKKKEAVTTDQLSAEAIATKMQAEIAAAYPKLTKRNAQFMHQLIKQLREQENEAKVPLDLLAIEHETITTLIDRQAAGLTAKHLYGTASDYARQLVSGNYKKEARRPISFFDLWIEGALLVGGLFAAMGAFSLWGNIHGSLTSYGIIVLILNFIFGGLAMGTLTYTQLMMQQRRASHPILKTILASIGVLLIWVGVISFASINIPANINVVLPAMVYVLIAAASFGARWWLKKEGILRVR